VRFEIFRTYEWEWWFREGGFGVEAAPRVWREEEGKAWRGEMIGWIKRRLRRSKDWSSWKGGRENGVSGKKKSDFDFEELERCERWRDGLEKKKYWKGAAGNNCRPQLCSGIFGLVNAIFAVRSFENCSP
jgi:hypothetical protein